MKFSHAPISAYIRRELGQKTRDRLLHAMPATLLLSRGQLYELSTFHYEQLAPLDALKNYEF